MEQEPITEEWLKQIGFKWHQLERQPGKHWLLWLGGAIRDPEAEKSWTFTDSEDLGIELADDSRGNWFCWLRSDAAHRYHRFIHVRHIRFRSELIALVVALTGQEWDETNHMYGGVTKPEVAARRREEQSRLDLRMREEEHAWYQSEKDPDRGRPLVEHMDAAIKTDKAK